MLSNTVNEDNKVNRLESLTEQIESLANDFPTLGELKFQVGHYCGKTAKVEGFDVLEVIAIFTKSEVEDVRQVLLDAYSKSLRNYFVEPSNTWREFMESTGKVGHSSFSAFSVLRVCHELYRESFPNTDVPIDLHGSKVILDEDGQLLLDGNGGIQMRDAVSHSSLMEVEDFLTYQYLLPDNPKGRKEDYAIMAYAALKEIPLVQMAAAQKAFYIMEF